MKIIEIWKLDNDSDLIILKGKPNPDVFWIEYYQGGRLVEKSEKIHEWNDEQLAALMEKFHWQTFETYSVHPLFTRLVSDFRKSHGQYKKPNSRQRILELYDRFLDHQEVNVPRTSYEFGVGPAEVKKDISILRNHLQVHEKEIVYIRNQNVYKLKK